DLENFQQLGEIIGSSKAQRKTLVINAQGLTGAEQKKLSDKLKREPTPEEKELARRKRQRVSAISILRGISIRMPLLIYGADVPLDDDITIDDFADLIDDASWKEFMPKGVTKKIFANFIKYYDREIFIEAGHRIRQRAKNADDLSPTDRVKKIADLFATFKNPDKETVLTPWKVINLHLNSLPEKIFAPDKKILDINAKTGLYPLWVAQKIFHARTDPFGTLPLEAQRIYWSKVVAENVFVVCKTPMAKKITQRTLLGYRDGKINAQFFDDLINTLKTNPAAFVAQVKKLWLGDDKMFFDAVVGNPPYQIAVEGDNKNYASPVYHLFLDTAFKLADKVSLITPAKFLSNAGDTPSEFNQRLLSDEHFTVVRYERDSSKFFPASYIEGGVVITLRDTSQTFEPIGIFTAFDELNSILQKVGGDENFQSFSKIMRGQMTYKLSAKAYEDFPDLSERLPKRTDTALRTNAFEVMPDIFLTDKPDDGQEYLKILGKLGSERVYRFVRRDYMEDLPEYKTYKVFVPAANGASGKLGDEAARIISKPVIGEPREGSTQTFITVGAFDSRAEADACLKYIKTKFARVMLGVLKVTQHNPPATWAKVPLQNFTAAGDIDWSQSIADIDAQLYRKYHLTNAEIKFIEEHVKAME
ncbi:MAG: Eco57I restriction-modification methylase domain-containing protein, partial [Selenomonadaceae bacterium]|nr:Eco57I restriction-modification methylase domain-containing protein [Selenomonadaceae bacterium]